ncbi:MAG TPA: cyclic-di-AMP receptor [Phototrophicaceae bacterium]|nr:cyclic-di-AMP receptor [Phototrophicaceae bacterium]
MKLIVAIVDDSDVTEVLTALTGQRFSVTRVSSTGGLLSSGNSTLLIGVDEKNVPEVMSVLAHVAPLRQSVMPATYEGNVILTSLVEIQVGGFQSFVLNVAHFEQV